MNIGLVARAVGAALEVTASAAGRSAFRHATPQPASLPFRSPLSAFTQAFSPTGQTRNIFVKVEHAPPDSQTFFHGAPPPFGDKLVEEGDADLGGRCSGREAGEGGAATIGGLYITSSARDAKRWGTASSYNLLGIVDVVKVHVPKEAVIARVPEDAVGNPNKTKAFANENQDAHVVMITGENDRLQLGVVTRKGATDPAVSFGVQFADGNG